MDESTHINLDLFPELPEANRPRALYFSNPLPALEVGALVRRGYEPVQLITLPRRTEREHQEYLLARAQGLTEGTIQASEEDRFRLRLEMEAHGLFKNTGVSVKVNLKGDDMKALFNWEPSRHTLRGNTTIVGQNLSSEAALEGKRQETLIKLQDKKNEVLRGLSDGAHRGKSARGPVPKSGPRRGVGGQPSGDVERGGRSPKRTSGPRTNKPKRRE